MIILKQKKKAVVSILFRKYIFGEKPNGGQIDPQAFLGLNDFF